MGAEAILQVHNICDEMLIFFPFLQQFIITIDRIDMEGGLVHFLGRDIHFPHGFGPRRDSSCWFKTGVICSGGEGHEEIHPKSSLHDECMVKV